MTRKEKEASLFALKCLNRWKTDISGAEVQKTITRYELLSEHLTWLIYKGKEPDVAALDHTQGPTKKEGDL